MTTPNPNAPAPAPEGSDDISQLSEALRKKCEEHKATKTTLSVFRADIGTRAAIWELLAHYKDGEPQILPGPEEFQRCMERHPSADPDAVWTFLLFQPEETNTDKPTPSQSMYDVPHMAKQPLAEVFGFPIDNRTREAKRCRDNSLYPFGNKVPNCTKDKANDPLGVCSILDGGDVVITCPVRFREKWIIAEDAARFFFPRGAKWTTLTEVRLKDNFGKSAGNIDVVLCSYNERGKVTDFGAL